MLQREFATRVVEARAMQDQQVRVGARLEAGFQAVLHRAFAGELSLTLTPGPSPLQRRGEKRGRCRRGRCVAGKELMIGRQLAN